MSGTGDADDRARDGDDLDRSPSHDELTLLAALSEGLTDEDAARRVGCTRRTLERRLRSAMDKLGAVSRFQAGFLVARAGWLDEG